MMPDMPTAHAARIAPVYITGMGAVTGYGWGVAALAKGLASAESAVTLQIGLEPYIPGGQAYLGVIPDPDFREGGISKFTRATRSAADEAIADARSRGWEPGEDVGVIVCTVIGDAKMWRDHYATGGLQINNRTWVRMMPSTVITMFMKDNAFHGPAMNLGAMCVSGNSAMVVAQNWIASGMCSDVVVVSADVSGTPENLAHFSAIGAADLATPALQACRPFQEGSIGFAGAEGVSALVVSARRHGTRAALLGGGITSDAHSAVSINPDHTQVYRSFQKALDQAGLDATDIVYYNAHGPGTAQSSQAEIDVVDNLFTSLKAVYALKPLLGHCQSAAPGLETIGTLLAYETGVINAPYQVAKAHPLLVDGPTVIEPALTVKAAIGFGGNNAAIILAPPAAM
jgi:3-oxoacyl-[acyl-carrier-protein] synthase II